jgi:hypothetical protein
LSKNVNFSVVCFWKPFKRAKSEALIAGSAKKTKKKSDENAENSFSAPKA